MKSIIAGIIIFCSALPLAHAATQYVKDTIFIQLRSGKGDEFRILKALKSGTRLEVIEQSDDGYAFVRTDEGLEGWVRDKYLSPDPVAADLLEKANQKIDKLVGENETLKQRVSVLRQELKEANKQVSSLDKANTQLEKTNAKISDVAARPMEIEQLNRELGTRNEIIEKEILELREINQKLEKGTTRKWFMTGAGVIVLGLVIGLIIPRIRWRRKSEWI
ncbi:MAG: TIGR04211 family SH3 domain-containing protein [Gammaproteobacteria bacterium]|nr:TIGR04211 family SH3 domain-containing protein [Gammaproteobacteria bacterium]MDH5728843.1 TIGR04211 family SH3 domain-containing protein [Gammaproteobacteria bacterium]